MEDVVGTSMVCSADRPACLATDVGGRVSCKRTCVGGEAGQMGGS